MSTRRKNLDSLRLYRRLLSYTWPYKAMFFFAIIGMLIAASMQPAIPYLMKPLTDEALIANDPDTMMWIPLALVGVFVVTGIGTFIGKYFMGALGRRVIFDVRNKLFVHMLRLPTSYYDKIVSGTLISKVIYDIEQIAAAATKGLFILIKDGVSLVLLLAWMFILNWKLTLGFVLIGPVVAAFVGAMSRRFRKTSRKMQQSIGGLSNVTQEATEGHRIVKAFGAQEHEARAFRVVNEKNRRQATRRVAASAANAPVPEIIAAVAIALVVYIGLQQRAAGHLTPGGFVAYFTALMLMLGPGKRLARVNEILQVGLAAAESVFTLMDEPEERDTGTEELSRVKGDIEYRHVSFRYSGTEKGALHDVSFSVPAGHTVALVGASGSGKSTAANLLPRFYAPDEGEILLDGVDISRIRLGSLRRHIALVSQESMLFNDSIRNNIAYGTTEAVDERRLQEAARAAHVTEFVQGLPGGFDTVIGEKGVRLSGGQRQRIAIARALYKDAPILILDEATSSLDTESERYVQEAMQELMKHRTTLVIAHRLSTIEHAHEIVVLDEGRVVETGTHQELIRRNGVYANLCRAQFDKTGAPTQALEL